MPRPGEIKMVAFDWAPAGWLLCDGEPRYVEQSPELAQAIGTTFGGGGGGPPEEDWFRVPDLRGRVPIGDGKGDGLTSRAIGDQCGAKSVALAENQTARHAHAFRAGTNAASSSNPQGNVIAQPGQIQPYLEDVPASALSASSVGTNAGGTQPHENVMPYQCINFVICEWSELVSFIGEIRVWAPTEAKRVPRDWLLCDGRVLPTAQNLALKSLLGSRYGGDGDRTFGLPDLRGRAPIGQGDGYAPGATGGVDSVRLTEANVPPHRHALMGAADPAASRVPNSRATLAVSNPGTIYQTDAGADLVQLAADVLPEVGGGEPHGNLQPFLAVNFVICAMGVMPERP